MAFLTVQFDDAFGQCIHGALNLCMLVPFHITHGNFDRRQYSVTVRLQCMETVHVSAICMSSHMAFLQEARLAGIPPLPSCWDHRQRSRSWTVPLQLPCLSTVRCKVILMFCSGQQLLLLLMHYTLLSADQTNRVQPQVKSAFHVTSGLAAAEL